MNIEVRRVCHGRVYYDVMANETRLERCTNKGKAANIAQHYRTLWKQKGDVLQMKAALTQH